MKKLILAFAVLLASSCHKAPKPDIITIFDTHFDILHGKVKRLTETYRYYNEPTTSTTDFNIYGNATQTKTTGGCDCLIKYRYRYSKNGKKTEAIISNSPRKYFYVPGYKYDATGRISESSADTKELKDEPPWNIPKQDKSFYKYDAAGDMVQRDGYLDTLHQTMGKYRYNSQHILIEADEFHQVRMNNKGPDLLNKRRDPDQKIIYWYKAFDAEGNWRKSIAVEHDNPSFYFGPKPKESVETYIEIRNITYY